MQPAVRIDLFSDTVTRPTPAMRRAIAAAEVGDEQLGEDPTVNRLQEAVAELLGKEAALFLPSGTMCNEIAFAVHCRAGDEILMDRTAHPLNYEAGGPSAISGAQIRALAGPRGIFTPEQVEAGVRGPGRWSPRSRLLSVEQTSNQGGGACWPIARLEAVCEVARRHGLATHMDGARLLNAVVATGAPASAHAAPFDSAWIDLSKGLGAPVGAVLAGSRDFVAEAWRWKQRLGGAMRQAGILAAAGVHALAHHVERLADDHTNARRLAAGLAELPGIRLDPESVETNIVFFDLEPPAPSARLFTGRLLAEHGVRVGAMGPATLRAVTHLDVSSDQVVEAIGAAGAVLGAGRG
ncbi:MAG: low specificity L-threonine aldolase [Gemmatimonadota bacterium]